VDDTVQEPRLEIPKDLLPGGLREQPAPRRGADAGPWRLPTVVTGLALALALGSGGIWLARRGSGRSLAAVLMLSLFLVGVSALWADVPVGPWPWSRGRGGAPPLRAPPVQRVLPAGIKLTDKVAVRVVDTGTTVKLVVNSSMVVQTANDRPESIKDAPKPNDRP
jgi:hypothetical protein